MSAQNVPVYQQIENEEIKKILIDLQTMIDDYLKIGLEYGNNVQYTVCGLDLIDVILRVDKRIYYFKVFHGMDCNEGKKAALFAYWIAKFRPIMITNPKYINKDGYNNQVNELFAIHYMLSALVGINRIKLWDGHDGVDLSQSNPSNPFVKRLLYSLRFRNFTIDSIIVLADAITTDTFKLSEKDLLP
jgi:hypothetical protein